MTVLIPVICCATANPTPTIIAGRKRGLSSSDRLRDDQLHVVDTGPAKAGMIDLVEDSVAESEPDATLVAEGFAKSGFSRWKSSVAQCRETQGLGDWVLA